MRYLLDTHILLWWLEDKEKLSERQREAIATARSGPALLLSDISLWEIATLVNLGRIRLCMPLQEWLERATALPLVARKAITPAVAAQVAALPDSFHRDPGDRIIVSTAMVENAALLTSDQRIINSSLVATVN